jgi:transcriptional regulator with XRE-family HTH domain
MPREQTVPAEAKVMRWARETRGYSLRRAAQELGIPQSRLEAIENDRQPVSATVFRKMISVYQQVESVLLLPEIPETDPLPEDYRTVGGVPRVPRPETLLAFREVRRIQRYVSELLTDDPELMLHGGLSL